jgi:hypothetical protein
MSLFHSSDRFYCLLYDMYNFNPLELELNRPDFVKAMDKIKNLNTILLQIVDI